MIRTSSIFALGLVLVSAAAAQAPSDRAAPPSRRSELIKLLDERFARVDADGDGAITVAEIEGAEAKRVEAEKVQVDKAVAESFAKLDTDRDGKLSLDEFRAGAPKVRAPSAAEAADYLKTIDANKDGKIGKDEFRARTLAAFDRLDGNKDGTITPEERKRALAAIGR